MDPIFDAGRLAHVHAVTVQQMTSWTSNDMAILGPEGETVATVVTRGSGLGRMLMGSREFDVVDGEDGRVLFHLQDPATFGRDRFQVFDALGFPPPTARARRGAPLAPVCALARTGTVRVHRDPRREDRHRGPEIRGGPFARHERFPQPEDPAGRQAGPEVVGFPQYHADGGVEVPRRRRIRVVDSQAELPGGSS